MKTRHVIIHVQCEMPFTDPTLLNGSYPLPIVLTKTNVTLFLRHDKARIPFERMPRC